MDAFRLDNTQGYSDAQLVALNRAFELAVVCHLNDSLYYDEDGELDIDRWREENPDEYQNLMERTEQNYAAE